jgi:putative endonuclease
MTESTSRGTTCRHIHARTGTSAQGTAAESLAAEFLADRGLVVLERNVRCKTGEIDLVCLDGEVLVMVEVRQRTSEAFGGALASVNRAKRRKLILSAGFILQRRRVWRNRRVRFDVVGVQGQERAAGTISWVKDAFRM